MEWNGGNGNRNVESISAHLYSRSTFSRSVMVSVAVSKMGMTELIFVNPGVKVNDQYYHDVLLYQKMFQQANVLQVTR